MSGGAPGSGDAGGASVLYNMQFKFSKYMVFLCAAKMIQHKAL